MTTMSTNTIATEKIDLHRVSAMGITVVAWVVSHSSAQSSVGEIRNMKYHNNMQLINPEEHPVGIVHVWNSSRW